MLLGPCVSDCLLASAGGGERLVWLLTPLVVAELLQVLCVVLFKQPGGDPSPWLLVRDERVASASSNLPGSRGNTARGGKAAGVVSRLKAC